MKISQIAFNEFLKKNFLFEKCPKIAVAVSGGPDSMVLVHLLNNWIKLNGGSLQALIIDHQFREESNKEAKIVKKNLLSKHINTKLIVLKKNDTNKKTMLEAREKRFEKLINYCERNNILHLFIAHHYDDNLETYLLRKIAGSNFEGLRSMQIKTLFKKIQILRPLLIFNKKDILNYNKLKNIFFVTDPSNKDLKYSRSVIREFLCENPNYKKQVRKDFREIEYFYQDYKKMIFQIFNKLNIYNSQNQIIIDNSKFLSQDKEIQIKIVEIIYRYLKPNRAFLRYQKTMDLTHDISNKKIIQTNLAGMYIKKDHFLIKFSC